MSNRTSRFRSNTRWYVLAPSSDVQICDLSEWQGCSILCRVAEPKFVRVHTFKAGTTLVGLEELIVPFVYLRPETNKVESVSAHVSSRKHDFTFRLRLGAAAGINDSQDRRAACPWRSQPC